MGRHYAELPLARQRHFCAFHLQFDRLSKLSKNATVRIGYRNIGHALVGYWRLDESTGLTAANVVAGGRPATVNGVAAWSTGLVGNAFNFDGPPVAVWTRALPASTIRDLYSIGKAKQVTTDLVESCPPVVPCG